MREDLSVWFNEIDNEPVKTTELRESWFNFTAQEPVQGCEEPEWLWLYIWRARGDKDCGLVSTKELNRLNWDGNSSATIVKSRAEFEKIASNMIYFTRREVQVSDAAQSVLDSWVV